MVLDRRYLATTILLVACSISPPASLRAQELERPPLPDYLQVAISESLERGKNYLMRSQQPTGTWTKGGNGVGYAALPGLTLLELGVPAKDRNVQAAADYVRRPRYRYQPPLVQFAREADLMRMVPMGEGEIDYPAFFTALAATGYGGYVAFEMCAPLLGGGGEENLDRCARGFLEYMQGIT